MLRINRPFVSRYRYIATHINDPDYDEDAVEQEPQEPADDEPEVVDGPYHVDDRGWP